METETLEAGISDRDLIEAVANSVNSDQLPGSYAMGEVLGSGGYWSMIQRLIRLGVMDEPAIGDTFGHVTEQARAACKAYLAR